MRAEFLTAVHQRAGFVRALGLFSNIPLIGIGLPVSVVVAPFLAILSRATARLPWRHLIGFAACVSIVAQMISAMANGTPVVTGSVAQITVFFIVFLGFPAAVSSLASAAQFIGWLSMGTIAYFLTLGIDEGRGTFEGLWKYGIAFPVTIVIVYALSLRGTARMAPAFALFTIGGVGIFLNFRSHGLICFIAAVLLLVKGQGRGGAARTAFLGLGGLGVLMWILPELIRNGLFGEEVRQRTVTQAAEGPLLLGGRTEPPLSIAAILEHPLVGWGSAQNIDFETIANGAQIAYALGLGSPSRYLGYWVRPDGFVSLHSIFFSSWVEGGVLAAIFPIVLIVLFVRAAIVARGRWAGIIVLVALQNSWDLMFSPWSTNKGVAVAAACIACGWAIREASASAGSGADAHSAKFASRL